VGMRFNPPPGWPPAPEGYTPPPGWQPDPSWPPAPPGWQLWINDDRPSGPDWSSQPTQTAMPQPDHGVGSPYGSSGSPYGSSGNPYGSQGAPYGSAGAPYGSPGGPYGNPGSPYDAGATYDIGTPYAAGTAYGPGAGYGAPGQYGVGGPYQPRGTSGWAVASLVLGLLGGIVLGAVFGFIALSRIKRLGQRGRGMAIAGIVLSSCWTLLLIIGIIGANLGQATRSPSSGHITHTGSLSVFSLAVGDCFDNPVGASIVSTVTALPCTSPHNAQIFAKFNLTGSDFNYPGTNTVTRLATQGCNSRIGSVNKSQTTSSMSVRFLFPEEDAWIGGRRTVSCMIVNSKANLTSSLLNP
jgi:hypothetical protein